jgi:hypothetical protein
VCKLPALLLAAVVFAAAPGLVDPTAPPAPRAAPTHPAGPQLQGILRTGTRDLAVIDGARVCAGERVGEWLVVEIRADSVRLRSERRELTLRLAPTIRIRATTRGGAP